MYYILYEALTIDTVYCTLYSDGYRTFYSYHYFRVSSKNQL